MNAQKRRRRTSRVLLLLYSISSTLPLLLSVLFDELVRLTVMITPSTLSPLITSLYIKVTQRNALRLDDALAIASETRGGSRILVYFEDTKQLRAVKNKGAEISDRLLKQLRLIMGEDNVAVK